MLNFEFISIKSKIGVEYRRYALSYKHVQNFDTFYERVEAMHQLKDIPVVLFYTDSDDVLLPINNDDNLAKAIKSANFIYVSSPRHNKKTFAYENNNCLDYRGYSYNGENIGCPLVKRPYLKVHIIKKGVFLDYYNGDLTGKYKKNQDFKGLSNLIASSAFSSNEPNSLRPSIGVPEDFRQVSSIIDVDSVPKTCRRVRIVKHGSDKPLGFYIRDGTYKRMNAEGQVELVTGVFISRLVPGGLAESTGLLAVNDEVLEVNGIQVMHGKTLDQVTDMMVANSSNLIMTIRPGRMNYVS